MEMGAMNGRGNDPNAILNETRDIDRGIETIERNLEKLKKLQNSAIADPDTSQNTQTNRQIDALNAETMNLYRNFTERIQRIRSQPASNDARNKAQVERVRGKLQKLIGQYQEEDFQYRKKLEKQVERQLRIVNPNATDEEVKAAIEDPSNPVFQQAVSIPMHIHRALLIMI